MVSDGRSDCIYGYADVREPRVRGAIENKLLARGLIVPLAEGCKQTT